MTNRDQVLKELTALGMEINPTVQNLPDATLQDILRASRKLHALDLVDGHADLERLWSVHIEMGKRGLTKCPLCNAVLVLEV